MSVLRNMLRLGYFHCLLGSILSSSLDQIIDVSCYNRYNNGTSYRGNVRRTENGTPCIKWKNSNSTYSHFVEDHNFCRNPLPLSKEIERPWCFTDAQLKYGKCRIPACVLDCRNTISDLNYNGTIHTTRKGNTCRLWNDKTYYPSEKANYCRTPFGDKDNGGGPWCYIDDGSWERCNIPVCGGPFCPDLSTYHLLTMDKKSRYQYGEIAIVVSCQKGYRHIEKTYLECISTGVWNATVPTCEEITCQPFILGNSVHASIQPDLNKYDVNTRITLSCIPGYIGPDTFTVCKADGQWSSQQTPRCTQITCQPFILDNSVHASIQPDLNKYDVNTRITLSCIPGYIGPDTFTVCKADGQWSSQQTPSCTPSDCKTLIVGVNVKPSKQLHKFNDEVTLSCEIGYIGDPISIKCFSNGSWPTHRPNCRPANCDDLNVCAYVKPSKQQHKFNDNVTLSCEEGYLGVPISIKCYANGSWPTDCPNCKPITCSMLTVNDRIMKSENISKFNDNVTLSCKQGYIRSSVILKCNATGFWPSQRPNCIDCRNSTIDLKYNGSIHTTRYGNTCRPWFTAPPHYRSETENYCRTPLYDKDSAGGPWCYIDDRRWERCNIPVCEGSVCPDLSTYHLLTMDRKSKYQYGEIAIVDSCQKGYIYSHIQKTYLECTSTGKWNDTIPTCEEITCQPFILDNNVHGSIQPDLYKYIFNTRVTLSCIPGYTGRDTVRVCRANGQWSSLQAPRCTPVTCQALRQMPHQKLEPDQMVYSYRDNITFKCNDGYELTTEYTMVTCQGDGTWSNKQPNCTEKSLSYKDSMKKRGKCVSYGLFGGILAAIVSISAGGHIATCFYYRKRAGKSATIYEDMKFNTVERQITSNEDTYSELT